MLCAMTNCVNDSHDSIGICEKCLDGYGFVVVDNYLTRPYELGNYKAYIKPRSEIKYKCYIQPDITITIPLSKADAVSKEPVMEFKIVNGIRYMFTDEETRMETHLIDRKLTERIKAFLDLFDHILDRYEDESVLVYRNPNQRSFIHAKKSLIEALGSHRTREIHDILVYLLEVDVDGN